MPANDSLEQLATRIGAFHITARAMKRAQDAIEAAMRDGSIDDELRESYLRAARRYFEGFAGEARTHLRDVDRRLEKLNQVHFNLTAERGVAVKRIEATQSVLDAISALGSDAQ
ncbi:MAG: hypothetical protein JO263_10925 [Candidatus Eremiobacteraeota bacterium]|nr:hypothetical protein [Candidatus Eremiobacteraeota bacterium]